MFCSIQTRKLRKPVEEGSSRVKMAAEENMCNDETQVYPSTGGDVQAVNIFTVEGIR